MRNHKIDEFDTSQRQTLVQQFYAIYCALNRQAELQRLVEWASRKRLKGPRNYYQLCLQDTQRRIFTLQVRSPRLTTLAWSLQYFNTLLFPTPRYFPSGAAKAYRNRRLAYPEKVPIIMYRQSA